MFVLLLQTNCTLFAYAQMNMLIFHDFSRFILGIGHCACCSVSLLFVGSATWMPARNVALPIDIGHCEMHSVLIMLLIRITAHRTSHHKSKQLTHFCNQNKTHDQSVQTITNLLHVLYIVHFKNLDH